MIIFSGTKKIGVQTVLVFMNETGSTIQIPVEDNMALLFLHHFDRLSPGTKPVETIKTKPIET